MKTFFSLLFEKVVYALIFELQMNVLAVMFTKPVEYYSKSVGGRTD
jgi:hypothetical protein